MADHESTAATNHNSGGTANHREAMLGLIENQSEEYGTLIGRCSDWISSANKEPIRRVRGRHWSKNSINTGTKG